MTARADDQTTLTVDGKKLTGWKSVEVDVGLEQMPNTFQIEASENSPVARDAVGVKEGSPCTVAMGADKVITGYVDTVIPYFNEGAHGVRLIGRGKCQDLVDCSAEWAGSQVSGSSAFEIAQKLAKPYGIAVKLNGPEGPIVPQFNINVGDSPADVLELVTRHAGLIYYEGPEGDLILAEVAADDAASGFAEGQNVQAASIMRSVAQRYSDYKCSLLSVDTSGLFQTSEGLFYHAVQDPYVGRHRQLVMVAEGVAGGLELAKTRALWESQRRAGRGRTVTLTADNWRDKAGKLWKPNTLAPVSLPTLKFPPKGQKDGSGKAESAPPMCISAVKFRYDLQGGRTADVTLMPRDSFLPEPIKLQPLVAGVV